MYYEVEKFNFKVYKLFYIHAESFEYVYCTYLLHDDYYNSNISIKKKLF